MNVTTTKMEAGRYRVMVDGAPTKLVIEKGEAPKYRHEQEWCIGIELTPGNVSYLSFDQRGLAGAVNTISAIIGQIPGGYRASLATRKKARRCIHDALADA